MDVYLVPCSRDGHELYTEEIDEIPEEEPAPGPVPDGFFARTKYRIVRLASSLKYKFQKVLAEAERERRRGSAARQNDGWFSRAKGRVMRWIAESIAEQRILWNLRSAESATFMYPDDLGESEAVALLRKNLAHDFEKHRFWLAINSLLMVGSALLIVIPGPNALGYYFAFRVVGHFFSVRGAKRGLGGVHWTNVSSAPLTELRRAIHLDPVARLEHAERVQSTLQLDHLASFFQRISVRST
jgi:hypothetical protein